MESELNLCMLHLPDPGPLTCIEWTNCGICRRSSLPWALDRIPLMWSPTSLDFLQKRTEWCVRSLVGKASLGMWVWEKHVGPARGSSLSQQKGYFSWDCWKVRGQMYPVPTLHSTQNPQLMLQLYPETLRAAVETTGFTTGRTILLKHKWMCVWKYHREQNLQCMGFTHSSWLEVWYLIRWVMSTQSGETRHSKLQPKMCYVQVGHDVSWDTLACLSCTVFFNASLLLVLFSVPCPLGLESSYILFLT